MLSGCSGYGKENRKKFHSTDGMKCCDQICYDLYESCKKNCLDGKCGLICGIQRTICIDNCEIQKGEWEEPNPYLYCAEKKGCIGYGKLNVKCLEENKKDLLSCCGKKCISTDVLDCQKQCDYFHTRTIKKKNYDHPSTTNIQKDLVHPLVFIFWILFIFLVVLVIIALG